MSDLNQRMTRSFSWLNATQFFGALNDNIFKWFIIFYLIGLHGEGSESRINSIAGAVFVVPFLLFIAAAGVVADRYSKRTVIVIVKIVELAVMAVGVLVFAAGHEAALYGVLFLMAMQSAFFGPSKYGIVPELVGKERLSRANGYLQAYTYLAIIIGTVLAPFLGGLFEKDYAKGAVFCVGFAVIGLGCSTRIRRTRPAGSDARFSIGFLGEIWRTLRGIRGDAFLMLAVIGSSYFLMVAAFLQLNIIPYGRQALGLTPEKSTYIFLLAAVGIGAGALAAGKVSGRSVEFGLVPIGAMGLAVFTIALWLLPPTVAGAAILILLIGVSAGIYIVPIQAFIQLRSPRERLGEILAASSFLSWVGVLIASGMLWAFSEGLHLTAAQGYLIVGVLTFGLTIVSFIVLPDFLLRFVVMIATRLIYRIRIRGLEHVPAEGPALLVPNHVSWIDPILMSSTQPRRIKFLMAREIYDTMGIWRGLLKLAGVIPVSSSDTKEGIEASLAAAREQLDLGYLVCIFAEGTITRSGMMRQFRSGFLRIVKGTEYPIIPVYIGGAWGSIFSYYYGRLASHRPQRLSFPVSIIFGAPLPASSTPQQVRLTVQELSCEYYEEKKPLRRPLPEAFAAIARLKWRQRALYDTSGKDLTFGRALTGAIALSRALAAELGEDRMVGIVLPASVGGALANVAVSMLGKAPVNLNFTSSTEAIQSAITQCGIRTVITSRALLERFEGLPLPERRIYLEDVSSRIGKTARAVALLKAAVWPRRALVRQEGFHSDDVATVLFSSGSTGTPKGVMLSHHNILSNIESANLLLRVEPTDHICGSLPFFHAFGYTFTLWMPLLLGIGASYHPNPLEAGRIAEVVRDRRCTIMIATPTFLLAYIRKAATEDFRTLRHCLVGAEKLRTRVADAFEKKFGLRPLEGYGATELSPLASVNVPDEEIDGVRQVGNKPGTIGHAVPGVAMKVVDPETGELLRDGQDGLLLVKGPNVMLGYLKDEIESRNVLRDGWYVTGDIVRMDREGFVTITDRLSRFSKIGGEMVPHTAIEDELLTGLNTEDRVVAVTALPDEKKGERLVVLYTEEAGDAKELQRILKESDLPNLWRPGHGDYIRVEAIPILGSGKLDVKQLRVIAKEHEQA